MVEVMGSCKRGERGRFEKNKLSTTTRLSSSFLKDVAVCREEIEKKIQ